ncbi:MAG: ATP-binding protein [Pseudomonadota bacterium]
MNFIEKIKNYISDKYSAKSSRSFIIVSGLFITVILALLDLVTGYEISFSIFYLIPIAFVSWFIGIRAGVIFSVLSAILWYSNEIIGGRIYSHPIIGYWNTIMRFLIFIITSFLISSLKIYIKRVTAAQEIALAASKMKTEFLANMSHEIRTPLTSILGLAELLSETNLDNEQRSYTEVFKGEGKHLLGIINDILDLSKVESGQYNIENIVFNIRSIIQEIISVMGVKVNEKGLELSYEIMPEVPEHLTGDPHCLRRIIYNLINNAVKFTEKGQIHLKIKRYYNDSNHGHLLFSIKDTGIGIPEDKIDQIFERFTQADSSITRKYGGTGLGLNITKNFLKLMGGSIRVESQQGKGSTFYFDIPFKLPDQIPDSETILYKPVSEKRSDNRALRILLVEDYEVSRRIIKAFLKKHPYIIDEAENGEKAVDKYKINKYDLILMDIQMPVMDGYTATKLIREWEINNNLKPVPIIALTAHAMKEDIEKSRQAGCNMHLIKPINKIDLIKTIYKITGFEGAPFDDKSVSAGKTRVLVDPDFKEIIPDFLSDMQCFYQKMLNALEQREFSDIKEISHKIKGAGGSYGFHKLSEIAQTIETAAKNNDIDKIRNNLKDYINYLNNVEVIHER